MALFTLEAKVCLFAKRHSAASLFKGSSGLGSCQNNFPFPKTLQLFALKVQTKTSLRFEFKIGPSRKSNIEAEIPKKKQDKNSIKKEFKANFVTSVTL